MIGEWRFERKRYSQKSRDPMQASFFTNASIDEDAQALIRELIQNSLDAKCSLGAQLPVKIRIKIGTHTADSGVMDHYISPDAWRHFNALDNGLSSPPLATDACRFLVYEDFNTQGLIGDERATDETKGNSFYYFMRAEGQSGKENGVRGRHGIGKYVVPKTSGIRMFIAATVRSTDGKCLVVGQSVLKSHHVDGQGYTPDGWWGTYEEYGQRDDYFQLPIENQALFQQIKDHFGLAREIDQSGLSLIMPYVSKEIAADNLSQYVVNEYFWPILSGQLVVEVIEE